MKLTGIVLEIGKILVDSLSNAAAYFEIDKEEIILSAKEIPDNLQGIYFFVSGEEIVYIGQSRNVHSRIYSHKNNAWWMKDEDPTKMKVAFLPVHDATELDLVEAFYIQKLKPCGNKNKQGNISAWSIEKQIAHKISSKIESRETLERIRSAIGVDP